MQVYELFDGVDWSPSPEKASDFVATIRKTDDRDWLKIPQPGESLDVFSGTDSGRMFATELFETLSRFRIASLSPKVSLAAGCESIRLIVLTFVALYVCWCACDYKISCGA